MAKYDLVDLKLSADGDLVIEKGDLATVTKQEFVNQSARNRMRVSDPEWRDYEDLAIGANLEDLRGKPNTREVANDGANRIMAALTHDGLLDPEDVYVRPMPDPNNRRTIIYFVFVNSPENSEPTGFQVSFNLDAGVTISGVS